MLKKNQKCIAVEKEVYNRLSNLGLHKFESFSSILSRLLDEVEWKRYKTPIELSNMI